MQRGFAVEPYDLDIALLNRLLGKQWYDLARVQTRQLEEAYPDRGEEIAVYKAQVLFYSGKREEALRILNGIPEDSRFYYDALRVRAELARQSGNTEQALDLYEQYFQSAPEPPEERRQERKEYGDALQLFVALLGQQSDARIGTYLKKWQEFQGAEGTDETDRQGRYLQAKITLDSQENAKDNDKPVDRKAVETVIEELGNLKYGNDLIAALSYVQRVRAHVLLDNYKKALDLIDKSKSYLAQFDKALRKAGRKSDSPLVGLFYYWGIALKQKAIAANRSGDGVEAKQYLLSALKRCRKVTVEYPDADVYPAKATVEFETIKGVLERLGLVVEPDGQSARSNAVLKAKLEEGGAFYQKEKFARAAEAFLEGIRSAPFDDLVPAAGVRLAVCYGQVDKFLEAQAVAIYLRDMFPDDPNTIDTFLNVGHILYQHRNEADPDVAERCLDDAMRMWSELLELSPAHPKAQEIAFAIAEHVYGKAKAAAEKSRDIDDPAAKKRQQQVAFDLYRQAIPRYEFLVENFGSQNRGVRALYKLGWIAYTLEDFEQSTAYFQRYAETETLEKYGDDVVEAKFRVGEIHLQQLEQPLEALEHFRQLVSWLEEPKSPIDPSTKTATQRTVDTESYIAWCYDFKAETFRGKLDEFDEQIDQRQDRIDALQEDIKSRQTAIQNADQRIEEAQTHYAEIVQSLSGTDVTLKDDGRGEQDASEAPTDDAELEEARERLAAEEARRRTAREKAYRKNLLLGEKIDFENRIKAAEEALGISRIELQNTEKEMQEAQETQGRLTEQIDTLRTDLTAKSRAIEAAREARQTLQQTVMDLEDQLTDVKERANARERKVREEAQREKAKLEQQVAAAHERLEEAVKREQEDASEQDIEQREQMRQKLDGLTTELEKNAKTLRRLQRQKSRLQAKIEINQTAREAFGAALEINELRRQELEASEAEVSDIRAKVAEELPPVIEKLKSWSESITKQQVQIQGWAQNDIVAAQKAIDELEKQIADLRQQQQPVRSKLEEWKKKAGKRFEAFVARYPDNQTHSPGNMSRLGGIYLEFGEFGKAVKWLEELRSRFPESKAGKQAMFDLGRALYENDEVERTARVFAQALSSAEALALGNLGYIARTMIEGGHPELAYKAAKEIIRRSEDRNHEEYETLQGARREAALYRAGKAALEMGDPRLAEQTITTLIDENDETGFFFDAMFVRAEALIRLDPPMYEAALADLRQVSMHAQDPLLVNEAAVELGKIHEKRGQENDLRRAASLYQQVVKLADPEIDGMAPLMEEALYRSAVVFTELKDPARQRQMIEEYQTLYPNGPHLDEIRALRPVRESGTNESEPES